jgi:uncharacterized protein YecT (DUF1311 family)
MRGSIGLLAIIAAGTYLAAASAMGQAASAAPDPSFACARAATPVERMICGDAELSALDRGIAVFYGAARRNPRHGRALREQREWLATRDLCATHACLREEMMDRLWNLTLSVGGGVPEYRSEDADAYLIIADLGGGWYAFGAEGTWVGSTVNDAGASGAFQLIADRGEIAAASEDACAYTLTRLPRDRWRIVAHEPPSEAACGGMNATVEGTYRRSRR